MLRPIGPIQGLRAHAMRCIAAVLAFACLSTPANAVTPTSTQSPRVAATSESFQLVGILKDGKLTIYLDREPDNVPVSGAKITVSAGGKSAEAAATKDGLYEIAAGDWAKPGENEMQFSIAVGSTLDLLGGVLIVPTPTTAVATVPQTRLAAMVASLPPFRQLAGAALLLGFGLVLGSMLSRRRGSAAPDTIAVLIAIACMSLVVAPSAFAGPGHAGDEGHSHGPDASAGLTDAASRLPDGSVFVPKPTQRLIEVRTGLAAISEARRHVRLPGRVVPSANGHVIDVALYDQAEPDAIRAAQAVAPSGVTAEVKLVARGTELKLNALPLTFSLPAAAPAALRAVGQRVTVVLETGDPIKGVVLPRAAVVTAPNGQSVVFEHTEPERFTPKQVLFSALDTERVVVMSGLADGAKIVLQAASLINQVR